MFGCAALDSPSVIRSQRKANCEFSGLTKRPQTRLPFGMCALFQPLSPQQQSEVLAALQKRAGGQAKKLIVDYVVNPQLMVRRVLSHVQLQEEVQGRRISS